MMTHREHRARGVLDHIERLIEREAVDDDNRYPDLARLRAEGQFWTAQRLPKPYHYHAPKKCFYNGMKLTLGDESLRYCEGYAGSVLPRSMGWFHHGWCVDVDGLVIDVTWRTSPRAKYYHDPEYLVYFGIPFDQRQVVSQFQAGNGIFLDAMLFVP